MTPYKLYINWTGKYTAGTMSGTFTDITDEAYDLNISVSRERDKKSIAIIRHFAKGSFVIKDSNYDLLQTAIANGLPELIIRIDKYSTVAVDYVEVWRGSAETRPAEMDDNRSVAKLSKFKTIDEYSDIETAYTHTWQEVFADYMTAPKGLYIQPSGAPSIFDMIRLFDTDNSTITDNFTTIDINSNITNKYSNLSELKIVPGYYSSGFVYFWGSISTKPNGIYLSSAYVRNNPTENLDMSLSIKKVMDMYKTLNNLYWYIDDATYGITTYDSFQFKSPSDLFGIGTIDYTSESEDFAAFSYLDTEYFIREEFAMSEKNQIQDHSTQSFQYQLLAENEFIYENFDLLTDTTILFRPNDFFDNKDLHMWIGEYNLQPDEIITLLSNTPYFPDVIVVGNYKASLAYRMDNFLKDYRQLDLAVFNGSEQALNPNIARPSLRQEAFPIELDLLSDLDFTATIQTSIGDTFAQEVIWDIKTNAIHLICQK